MTLLGENVCFSMKYLHRCIEAHLHCSNGILCLLIALEDYRRVKKPLKTFNYVSTAENSYAGERSYKTGLPLSLKNKINISNTNHYF